ncbi:ROK family protein [Bacillota bacterium Meth-B3]|nr:ROK family protein [Christensenellaceae bacterium]MEA5067244.1 ROK family protein [Eubacteriales bacterium]
MISDSIIENRKYFKRNKILYLIRTAPRCSRFDVKKLTSYSMSTVLSIIDELVQSGFIYEEESSDVKVGRKPTWLRINPDYGVFIGVEFHFAHINCAMLDFQGNIAHQSFMPFDADTGAEEVLEKVAALISDALMAAGSGRRLLGIGVGIPGYGDFENGIGIEYAPIKSWRNIPVKAFIESRFSCPCFVENNVTSMAMGYKYAHMVGGSDDFLFVSVRTGIRIVPVINNELFLSNKGYAGQLGHVKVMGGSRMCICGRRGCLNTEVADTGLRSKLIEDILAGRQQRVFELAACDLGQVTVPLFVQAVMEGCDEAIRLLKETAACLGQALGMMLDILAPRRVIVYGELCRVGDLFLEGLVSSIRDNAMPVNTANLSVILLPPDERLGATGAAQLVLQKQFEYLKETV